MAAPFDSGRTPCGSLEAARHRHEAMPSALELFGFGSEDEPPSPA
ncbi:hypothetical protein [Nocardia sp. NBC_00511]